jgi:hypothetical protein
MIQIFLKIVGLEQMFLLSKDRKELMCLCLFWKSL